MNLVPYTLTALSRQDIPDTPTDRNIVVGAVVTCVNAQGATVTMFDNAEGANGSTAKQTGVNGQVTVYVDPGEYTFTVNGRDFKVAIADGGFADALAATDSDVLVGGAKAKDVMRQVSTVESLRLTVPRGNGESVSLVAYRDGWAGLMNPPKSGGVFAWDSELTTSDNGGTIFAVAGIATGRWVRQVEGYITPDMFGAYGDDLTQSSVTAIQAAIDYCNSFTQAKKLKLVSRYRVNSQLFIDRMVDTTTGEFIVEGSDESTGLYINSIASDGSVFGSRIPYGAAGSGYTKQPVTEFCRFEGVAFINDSTTPDIWAFDDKYLRLEVIKCKFRNIRIIYGDQYLQTIRVDLCKTKQHVGYLIDCGDSYDVKFTRNTIESGFGGVYNRGNARALQVDYNLAQSNGAALLRLASGNFSFCKNYMESNGEYCQLGVDSGSFGPCDVSGNIFFLGSAQASDPSYYPLTSNQAVKMGLNDNVSTGNLLSHVNTRPFAIKSSGNTAVGNVLNTALDVRAVVAIPGGQLDVNPVTTQTTIVNTASSGGGVVLPKTKQYLEESAILMILNRSAETINVYPNVDERILGVAYNSPTTLAAGATLRLLNEKTDTWIIV